MSLLTTALLCCSLAFAQGAEDGGTVFELIPRLDVNPYIPVNGNGYSGFDLSNTSLYTLFEGGIGESDFSYSVEGHWLSSDPAALYKNVLRSDETNFLDWAYVTYAPGNFELSLGKMQMAFGTFEIDEYDFNSHIALGSTVWQNLNVYQWAARLGYVLPGETVSFAAEFSSSPYSERPFQDNTFSYSAIMGVDTDIYAGLHSFNLIGCGEGAYVKDLAFGNQFYLGDCLTLTADFMLRGYEKLTEEVTGLLSARWQIGDALALSGKFGIEGSSAAVGSEVFGWDPVLDNEDPADYYVPASLAHVAVRGKLQDKTCNYIFGGLAAEYTLFDNLRLHAVAAYNNWSQSISLNFGATYFLELAKHSK